MKKAMMTVMMVLLGAGWAGANMIQNGDFDSSAAGWTFVNTSSGGGGSYASSGGNPGGYINVYAWDGTGGNEGRYWVQGVAVTPGTNYNLSFDYTNTDVYSYARVDFWQGPGENGWLGQDQIYDYLGWGWAPTLNSTGGDWVTKTASFTTPSNCNFIEVKFEQNTGYSTLNIDNVNLVPEPATMSLVLLGLAGLLRRR